MLTQELLNGKNQIDMLVIGILALIGFGLIAWWVIDGERKLRKDD